MKKETSKFEINDYVEWTSSSGGFAKNKKGKIVAIIPPNTSFTRFLPRCINVNDFIFNYGGGIYRNHESYAVSVELGTRAKPKLYWPFVSKLKKVSVVKTKK